MRFCETTIRTVGRTSQGVRSMRITGDEKIIDLMLVKPDSEILTVTQKGYAKRTRISDYRIQGRGGKGIKAGNFNEKTGKVVAIKPITIDKDILAITNNGITIRTHAEQISLIGRASQGVKMMRIKDDSFIVSVAVVERQDEEEIDNITEQINEETQNQE